MWLIMCVSYALSCLHTVIPTYFVAIASLCIPACVGFFVVLYNSTSDTYIVNSSFCYIIVLQSSKRNHNYVGLAVEGQTSSA